VGAKSSAAEIDSKAPECEEWEYCGGAERPGPLLDCDDCVDRGAELFELLKLAVDVVLEFLLKPVK
jgi:hypothetical protein